MTLMPLIKNCLYCKNNRQEWYQDNSCTSDQVRAFSSDGFGNKCVPTYPSCKDVHPIQNEDCPYFELSFAAKVARLRSKICMFFHNLKIKV